MNPMFLKKQKDLHFLGLLIIMIFVLMLKPLMGQAKPSELNQIADKASTTEQLSASITRPLQANQAFSLHVQPEGPDMLNVSWKISPGYFLYKDRIALQVQNHKNVQLGQAVFPKARIIRDNTGKKQAVYTGTLHLLFPVLAHQAGSMPLIVHFQGCSAQGFCYPPQQQLIFLDFDSEHILRSASLENSFLKDKRLFRKFAAERQVQEETEHRTGVYTRIHEDSSTVSTQQLSSAVEFPKKSNRLPAPTVHAPTVHTPNQLISKTSFNLTERKEEGLSGHFMGILQDYHWLMAMLVFYFIGLLMAFTPCILPMVPILSEIIVGHKKNLNTRRAFLLSATYVLGMAVTYAVTGAIMALLGANIQMFFQNIWVLTFLSLVFIVLALSMFDLFTLNMPQIFTQSKLGIAHLSGSYLHAACMGIVSILIVSPCVTAPLIGILGYISSTGKVLLGALSLFALGIGMGTPLLMIGTSAGRWLPTNGPWMVMVKKIFGFLLLALAISLISRVISHSLTMILWAILFICSGLYLGGFTHLDKKDKPSLLPKVQKILGIMVTIYGLFIIVGTSKGESNVLQPLAGLFKAQTSQSAQISAQSKIIHSVEDLHKALKEVRGSKSVLIDFYADWCTSCKIMEARIAKNEEIQQLLKHFLFLKVDLTKNTPENQDLLKELEVIAPPTFLFYDRSGKAHFDLTLVGEVHTATLIRQLEKAWTD